MRFALPDDAVALREGLREVLTDVCTPAVVRAAWDGSACEPLWKELGAFGALGVLLPEADGGLGLDELSFVAALEEAGWHGVPGPLVETTSYLPTLGLAADGTARVAVQRTGVETVPYAGSATHVLREDDSVLLSAFTVTPAASVDASRQVGVVTGDGSPVDLDPTAAERATLGTAAFLLGLARRQLDVTVAYVKERQQFGVPVGSFQAVKHPLADAVTGTDLAWPVVMRAAASLAQADPDTGVHVSMAKALASDAAYAVSRACLQAHGAMAYTVEYDLHLFAKRTWAMARDWGSSSDHRARIGAHLGLEDT